MSWNTRDIDMKKVKRLLDDGWSQIEIARFMDIGITTLKNKLEREQMHVSGGKYVCGLLPGWTEEKLNKLYAPFGHLPYANNRWYPRKRKK